MATPKDIQKAAKIYCTDRTKFLAKYKGTLHHQYLDMLFLEAGTRPDLAEEIPLWVLGHTPIPGTHGFDGVSAGPNGWPVECKTCSCKSVACIKHFGNIQINDISQNTIDKYDAEQPEILFSFFIEGHLIAIYEILWDDVRPFYVDALKKPGRKCVTLTRKKWEEFGLLRFKNSNNTMIEELVPKKFKELLSR